MLRCGWWHAAVWLSWKDVCHSGHDGVPHAVHWRPGCNPEFAFSPSRWPPSYGPWSAPVCCASSTDPPRPHWQCCWDSSSRRRNLSGHSQQNHCLLEPPDSAPTPLLRTRSQWNCCNFSLLKSGTASCVSLLVELTTEVSALPWSPEPLLVDATRHHMITFASS